MFVAGRQHSVAGRQWLSIKSTKKLDEGFIVD
jgi:hypothetical protein